MPRERKGIRVFTGIHAALRETKPAKWMRVNLKGSAADAAIFSIQRDRRERLRILCGENARSEPNDFQILLPFSSLRINASYESLITFFRKKKTEE